MWFFITMYICNMTVPGVMLLGGYLMYKHPPKEINGMIGYRTTMSRKNRDTWEFAHDYCGRLWIKIGLIMLIISAFVQLPFLHSSDDVVGIMTLVLESVQVIALVCSIIPVEAELKRKFDQDGKRKE